MILLAEGLFRLDVTLMGDTLKTLVRNLSAAHLELEDGLHPEVDHHLASGEAEAYEPAQGRVAFSLGSGDDRVEVEVMIATLRFAHRGTVRVTAQAVIRQEPVE